MLGTVALPLEREMISFRMTAEAKQLLKQLADKSGVSKTAYLEILLREKAKAEGITTSAPENEKGH